MIYLVRLLIIAVILIYSQAHCAVAGEPCRTILVVHPRTELRIPEEDLDRAAIVDLQILEVQHRLAEALYDCLVGFDEIDLRTQFSTFVLLLAQIDYENRQDFIDTTRQIIGYVPDAYLFASMDKTTDRIVLRAEILDLGSHPLAVAKARIGFSDFLNDEVVLSEVSAMCKSLASDLRCKRGGFISLREYVRERKLNPIDIGVGLSIASGSRVRIGDIAAELRRVPPHSDDKINRPDDILSEEIPDNYLIQANSVEFDLRSPSTVECYFGLLRLIRVGVRSSATRDSDILENENLFRKNYIRPEIEGEALIFYSIGTKTRSLFGEGSFSIPIIVSYPVYRLGPTASFDLKLLLGTNALLPSKIQIEAVKGWDRFGEKQPDATKIIGDVAEREYIVGVELDGSVTSVIGMRSYAAFVFTDFGSGPEFPAKVEFRDRWRIQLGLSLGPSLAIGW